MIFQTCLSVIVPITTSIQLLPQLYKTYQTKSVDDISFNTLILILFNNLLWLMHGVFISDYSLIISGFLSIIINLILVLLFIKYK